MGRLFSGTLGRMSGVLGAAALLLAGAAQAGAQGSDTLRWSVPADLGGRVAFHALANPAAYPRETSLSLYNGLTKLNPSEGYRPMPDLAESWEVSPDGLTYTFRLRDDVVWHDGAPFTSADVTFTIGLAKDKKHNTSLQADLRPVESVEAPDAHTVVLRLGAPYAPLLANLAFGILPRHIVEPQVADGTPLAQTAYATAPVGTGPYRFVSLAVGQEMVLEANPRYHRGAPAIKRVVFLLRQNGDATVLKLKAGETDGAQVVESYFEQVRGDARYNAGTLRGTSPLTVLLNLAVEPMGELKVRQALNRFLDKDELVALATSGLGSAAYGPFPNTAWDSSDPAPLAYDPEDGARLLTEVGFARDGAGFWARDGKRLSFELNDGFGFVQMSEAMASQWRKAGIDVTVNRTDFPTIWANLPQVAALTYRFGSPSDPDSVYTLFHSTATRDTGGFNAGLYSDPAVDAALDAGRHELAPEARKAAYDALQAALSANPPYAWGVVLNPAYAVAADVTGYTPDIYVGGENLGFLFWNVEQWRRGSQ